MTVEALAFERVYGFRVIFTATYSFLQKIPTILKKLTAISLLLLFSIVLGAKVSHSHETELTHGKGITISDLTGNCTLCDYQLSRDAEVPVQPEYYQRPVSYPGVFIFPGCRFNSVTPVYLAGRGPPAA